MTKRSKPAGRRVTADERDWETCCELDDRHMGGDCGNRPERFFLGDFYCKKHAPAKAAIRPAKLPPMSSAMLAD